MTKMQVGCGSATAQQAHQLPLMFAHAQFELGPPIHAIRELRLSKEKLGRHLDSHDSAVVQLTQQIASVGGPDAMVRLKLISELDRQRGIELQLLEATKQEIEATDARIGMLVGEFFGKLFEAIDPIHEVTFAMLNNIRGELDVAGIDVQSLEAMRASTLALRARMMDVVAKNLPHAGTGQPPTTSDDSLWSGGDRIK